MQIISLFSFFHTAVKPFYTSSYPQIQETEQPAWMNKWTQKSRPNLSHISFTTQWKWGTSSELWWAPTAWKYTHHPRVTSTESWCRWVFHQEPSFFIAVTVFAFQSATQLLVPLHYYWASQKTVFTTGMYALHVRCQQKKKQFWASIFF